MAYRPARQGVDGWLCSKAAVKLACSLAVLALGVPPLPAIAGGAGAANVPASGGFVLLPAGDLRAAGKLSRLGSNVATPATASPAPLLLQSEMLSVELDPFGGLGSATSGSDALFGDGGSHAGTVFEESLHVRGLGFLHARALLLPAAAAGSWSDGEAVGASYRLGPFQFDVTSSLLAAPPGTAVLEQGWTVTNVSAAPSELVLSVYLDGDLQESGRSDDDVAAHVGDDLLLLDRSSSGDAAVVSLGLTTRAVDARRIVREAGEFDEQRGRLASGGHVADRLVRAGGSTADADGDGVSDAGFDASLVVLHDFGALAPGQAVTLDVLMRWERGSSRAQPVQAADAGPDRMVGCDGRDGTLVRLDAGASCADTRARCQWTVDGVEAEAGPTVDVLVSRGAHEARLVVIDAAGRTSHDAAVVEVVDRAGPVVVVAMPAVLWPPDHRLVPVALPVRAADACSGVETLRVLAVSCDECAGGTRGRTAADWLVDDAGTLWLRRERLGTGDGRTYAIHGEAVDAAGNAAPFTCFAVVPHDARGGGPTPTGPAIGRVPRPGWSRP